MYARVTLTAVAVALFACSGEPRHNPVRDALAATPFVSGSRNSVAFRFPARGGTTTTLYRLPDMEEVAWRFESGGGHVARVVGFSPDEDLLYSLSDSNRLIALDLGSGRARIIDSAVALAAVGPTGTPHFVRVDGTVASIERRALRRWDVTFDTLPTSIWGGARERLIALFDGNDRQLHVISEGQPAIVQPLPAGQFAISQWGDVAAVAADSGVVVINPIEPQAQAFAPITGATHVGFSPSGHRMYVGAGSTLVTLERFDLVIIETLELPGSIEDVRFDQLGVRALLRPFGTDSVWVVDIVAGTIERSVATEWGLDLPVVAYDGTLLTRWQGQVAATPRAGLGAAVSIPGGADRWSVAAWDPRRPALELATEVESTDEPPGDQRVYVQLSSSQNADWAVDFSQNLRRAGVDASVLPPGPREDLYRVVLGPYPSRDEADRAAQRLGLPYWIYAADTTGAPDSTSFRQD